MNQNRWHSPYFHKDRFSNYPGEKTRKTFWRAIQSFIRLMFSRPNVTPEEMMAWVMPLIPPVDAPSSNLNTNIILNTHAPSGQESQLTWIGHSTFLIRVDGKTILTDPIFDTLSYFLRFPRLLPAGIALQNLPHIDTVLISHNHPDHMDASTLYFLEKMFSPLFLVPYGDKAWFDKRGFKNVRECTWWDRHEISSTLECTFLPAIHWSQRGLFDRNKSLWGGWMIESKSCLEGSIYFAGDTAYGSHFNAIAKAFPDISVALMPIGPAEPRELMFCSHINPEEAGRAFLDLEAQSFVPMHWGTYHLGIEHPLEPIKRLHKWWEKSQKDLSERTLLAMKIGQKLSLLPKPALITPESSVIQTLLY